MTRAGGTSCHLISCNMWAGDRRKMALLADLAHHLFLSDCKDLGWKAHSKLGVPHWCTLTLRHLLWNKRCHSPPPDTADYARLSYLLWLSLRGTKATSVSNLPSFRGVFGGIFSLLSCWKALEGSKRLMPCTAHSCSWRCLLVCFSLASNARSFETSWRRQYWKLDEEQEKRLLHHLLRGPFCLMLNIQTIFGGIKNQPKHTGVEKPAALYRYSVTPLSSMAVWNFQRTVC